MGVVYAVFRNGLWDDPAVASTGSIAQSFALQATSSNFKTERIAPYLTWRFCYLLCGVAFGIARVVTGWPWKLNEGGDRYKQFLEKQLPRAVDVSTFDTLIQAVTYLDAAMWCFGLACVLLTVASAVTALPSKAIKCLGSSQRLLWLGWIIAFLPPFISFMVFPYRSLVDWENVVADVCTFSTSTVFASPAGKNLKPVMEFFGDAGKLPKDLQGLTEDSRAWCAQQGANWHESFYGTFVGCNWAVEDTCVDVVCSAQTANLASCLQNCVAYARQTLGTQAASQLISRLTKCVNGSAPFHLKAPTAHSGAPNDRDSILEMYQDASYAQRIAIVQASEAVTLASTQAEYIVGAFIALVGGKYLIPSALSLLGGLSEALLNNKAMFPGSQHGAWILILTTCEVVPVYASLLAMFQQLVGDALLAVACVLATVYGSLGMLTGCRILSLKSGDAEREKLYKRVWLEYGLRMATATGIAASAIAWALTKHAGLQDYVQNELLNADVIIFTAIDVLAKKAVTAIAGTDIVLNAFVKTELWSAALPLDAKDTQQADVQELGQLLKVRITDMEKDAGANDTPGTVQVHGRVMPDPSKESE